MATIGQHISDIRGLLKEYSRNPGVYSDQFLYSLLNGGRAKALERNSNRINHNSEWDFIPFPIALVKDKSHMIGCVQVGCDIMRSEYKIPRALLVNNKSMFDVFTYSWKPIVLGSEIDWLNSKYDDVKSKQINASIINGYLIIWNKLNLKSVIVKGIWEDITDWAVIPQCDEDGEIVEPACYDPLTKDFPLSETMKDEVYEYVAAKLQLPKQQVSDQTNDSNNEIRI